MSSSTSSTSWVSGCSTLGSDERATLSATRALRRGQLAADPLPLVGLALRLAQQRARRPLDRAALARHRLLAEGEAAAAPGEQPIQRLLALHAADPRLHDVAVAQIDPPARGAPAAARAQLDHAGLAIDVEQLEQLRQRDLRELPLDARAAIARSGAPAARAPRTAARASASMKRAIVSGSARPGSTRRAPTARLRRGAIVDEQHAHRAVCGLLCRISARRVPSISGSATCATIATGLSASAISSAAAPWLATRTSIRASGTPRDRAAAVRVAVRDQHSRAAI